LVDKTPTVRLATFLSVIGEDGLDRYNNQSMNRDFENVEEVVEAFDNEFKKKTNILYERHRFLTRK